MRLARLRELAESLDVDAVVITSAMNVFYYTKLPRPYGSVILYRRGDGATLYVPGLDYWRAKDSVGDAEIIPYSKYELEAVEEEAPKVVRSLTEELVKQVEGLKLVGIDAVTPLANQVIKKIEGRVGYLDASKAILEQRKIKTPDEVAAMEEALRITEEALKQALSRLEPGMREYELAAILEEGMRARGADWYAFETIVAAGPNGAYPHAVPTAREIVAGEPVIVDMGAIYGGYCADMTRTIYVGRPPREVREVVEAVAKAAEEAEDVAGPGVTAEEVDRAAREYLRRAGLGKYFIHSTGHGVGVEVHEPPRIAPGVKEELRPGMVFTIEPGVYLHGRFGVRIEDMVLITESGAKVLNRIPKIIEQ